MKKRGGIMGLFNKIKNVFTEEVEEEPIKKEVRQVEIPGPTEIEKKDEEKKEEKFVFPVYFDDKDFDELKPKEEKKEPVKKEVYGIKVKEVKVDKKFTPSPVISPVYGVLEKNYNKEDIVSKKAPTRSNYKLSKSISVEDVRRKAYGTLEDDLETSLFKEEPEYIEEEIVIEETPIEIVENHIVEDLKPKIDTSMDNMTLEELNKLEPKEEEKEDDLFNLIDSMYEKGDDSDSWWIFTNTAIYAIISISSSINNICY